MPANKNAMTRYKILDELLSSRYHNYSLEDLTAEVNKRLADLYPDANGVVRRTIEKDIHYLEYEGPFMADIERYSVAGYNHETQKSYAKQCLRYASPSFSIFKNELTDEEQYLLREALSLLGQFDGLPNLGGLENLRLSLGVNEEKQIISFTKNPLGESNLLGELFTAISQKQVVQLRYHTFQKADEVRIANLFPYLLKEYNHRWYLLAASEDDGKVLTFSLDRINEVVPMPAHKYIAYNGDINERFEDVIGITCREDSPVYKILFWVSDLSKDYVATKPVHESQKNIIGDEELELRGKYPSLAGGRFFQIDCKENYELIRELTGFGRDLIVLEPSEIRGKVLDHIRAMYEKYQLLRT